MSFLTGTLIAKAAPGRGGGSTGFSPQDYRAQVLVIDPDKASRQEYTVAELADGQQRRRPSLFGAGGSRQAGQPSAYSRISTDLSSGEQVVQDTVEQPAGRAAPPAERSLLSLARGVARPPQPAATAEPLGWGGTTKAATIELDSIGQIRIRLVEVVYDEERQQLVLVGRRSDMSFLPKAEVEFALQIEDDATIYLLAGTNLQFEYGGLLFVPTVVMRKGQI